MYWDMQASKLQNSRIRRALVWCIGILLYLAVKLTGSDTKRKY
jgi:hypothetical protein